MIYVIVTPRGFVGQRTTGGYLRDDLPYALAYTYESHTAAVMNARAFDDAIVVTEDIVTAICRFAAGKF